MYILRRFKSTGKGNYLEEGWRYLVDYEMFRGKFTNRIIETLKILIKACSIYKIVYLHNNRWQEQRCPCHL